MDTREIDEGLLEEVRADAARRRREKYLSRKRRLPASSSSRPPASTQLESSALQGTRGESVQELKNDRHVSEYYEAIEGKQESAQEVDEIKGIDFGAVAKRRLEIAKQETEKILREGKDLTELTESILSACKRRHPSLRHKSPSMFKLKRSKFAWKYDRDNPIPQLKESKLYSNKDSHVRFGKASSQARWFKELEHALRRVELANHASVPKESHKDTRESDDDLDIFDDVDEDYELDVAAILKKKEKEKERKQKGPDSNKDNFTAQGPSMPTDHNVHSYPEADDVVPPGPSMPTDHNVQSYPEADDVVPPGPSMPTDHNVQSYPEADDVVPPDHNIQSYPEADDIAPPGPSMPPDHNVHSYPEADDIAPPDHNVQSYPEADDIAPPGPSVPPDHNVQSYPEADDIAPPGPSMPPDHSFESYREADDVDQEDTITARVDDAQKPLVAYETSDSESE